MPSIANAARTMLEQTIIPFWKALRDDEYGGYYGLMDYDLCVNRQAEKGCILNSRILWFFSEAAILTGREDLCREADHAYTFLTSRCWDWTNGGIYWSVTYDGKPLDTTKHTYNQAFAIYALSAYYRLTGNPDALSMAWELFQLVEHHCTDAEGYLEAFTVDWQSAPNDKLSENGVLAAKTMNTLLHVFEGYAGLYQASGAPVVRQAMGHILVLYRDKIYDPTAHRLRVFFDEHYHSLIDLHSYGHDIECSWLIDWGCELMDDPALAAEIHTIDHALANKIYQTAYRNHSLATECDRGVVDTTRVWWVQAEAVLGFVNQWQKHPEETKYRDAAADIYQYICRVMVDKRPGSEWFWSVDEHGTPYQKPIVEPWKCPYHNGRMCIELIRRNPNVTV
ncbi:MAG: AGE family epimerase/isomerase [Clostridiales bacterium]|nr:AGE family epimerase/isomerase [Clostridiales bacterium]